MVEEFITPTINIAVIAPFIIICLAGLILMFVDAFLPEKRKHLTGWLTLFGIVPALLWSVSQWNLGPRTAARWREAGVRTLPGAYLSRDVDGINPGQGYIRVAMVVEEQEMQRGLKAIRDCLYR